MHFLLLVSGGIDSPVAGHLLLEQGASGIALHMDNRPFTDDSEVNKALDAARLLGKYHGVEFPVFMAPHGIAQASIGRNCTQRLQCVLCRRQMLRVASALAVRENCDVMVTGESMGQVASQTIDNLGAELTAASVPILRPLIGWDKQQIVNVAREIGSYDISSRPGSCCTITPQKPALKASSRTVEREEEKLDLDSIMESTLGGLNRV